MVGAFLWPTRPTMPIETGRPSVKARAGSWQVAHATVPSADNRPSKNSFWPSSTFSGASGLSGGTTTCVSCAGRPTWFLGLGCARIPALGMGGALPGGRAGPPAAPSCPELPGEQAKKIALNSTGIRNLLLSFIVALKLHEATIPGAPNATEFADGFMLGQSQLVFCASRTAISPCASGVRHERLMCETTQHRGARGTLRTGDTRESCAFCARQRKPLG